MRGVVNELRDDGSARLWIPPELRFHERQVAFLIHEDQINEPTPDTQFTGQREQPVENRLDVSDWNQLRVLEQQSLQVGFLECSIIEWYVAKHRRGAVADENRRHELSVFHRGPTSSLNPGGLRDCENHNQSVETVAGRILIPFSVEGHPAAGPGLPISTEGPPGSRPYWTYRRRTPDSRP